MKTEYVYVVVDEEVIASDVWDQFWGEFISFLFGGIAGLSLGYMLGAG